MSTMEKDAVPERPWITCTCVGVYRHALTRGKRYQLIAKDENYRDVLIRDDRNERHWYNIGLFDLAGDPVISLVRWKFDEPVVDESRQLDETNNWVEVTVECDDGTQRWCSCVTPDYLKRYLNEEE